MNIKGINKGEILASLYNASHVQGLGFLQADGKIMTESDAWDIINKQGMDFDYLKGKVMKIYIGGDDLNTRLYNRDNGEGAAERALSKLIK